MTATTAPLGYTATEIRSYLPSGWGIVAGQAGAWNERARAWSVEVYDHTDTTWKVTVDADAAARAGRLEALRDSVVRLERRSLGRKSVISG